MNKDFVEVSTYEHLDGFYIFKREDNGQEVSMQDFNLLEIISIKDNKLTMPKKGANAILFLETKIDDNQHLRGAYYINLKRMYDDGIRSFCNRKIYGKNQWLNDMKNSNYKEISSN